MKQKDFALIAIIVVISAIISIFVSKSIFVKPKNRQQQVEVVQAITSDFTQPSNQYYNSNSFDPTKPIVIGENANPDPFSSRAQ